MRLSIDLSIYLSICLSIYIHTHIHCRVQTAGYLTLRPPQVDIQFEPANGGWVTSQISGKKEESCMILRSKAFFPPTGQHSTLDTIYKDLS